MCGECCRGGDLPDVRVDARWEALGAEVCPGTSRYLKTNANPIPDERPIMGLKDMGSGLQKWQRTVWDPGRMLEQQILPQSTPAVGEASGQSWAGRALAF
jgi:hypothetical protein